MIECPNCGYKDYKLVLARDTITFPETIYVTLPQLASLSDLERVLGQKLKVYESPIYTGGLRRRRAGSGSHYICSFSTDVWTKIDNGIASLATYGKTHHEALNDMIDKIQGTTLMLRGVYQDYCYSKLEVKINQIYVDSSASSSLKEQAVVEFEEGQG